MVVDKHAKEQWILWFEDICREDVAIVGGKSASLGEMTSKTGVPVPYGFATTAQAYRTFLRETGLDRKISEMIANLTNVEDSRQLREISAGIRQVIVDAKLPKKFEEAIKQAYVDLAAKVGEEQPFVAVRSSATAEDLPDASFAGQQETYLNVRGADEVVERVKECFASMFTDRAVYYRTKKNFSHTEAALSAVVQMMVFSAASGVMFTVNVVNGDDRNILIEGSWGLGEYIVQGTVTPDHFWVAKADLEITERSVHEKTVQLVRRPGGGVVEKPVPDELKNKPVLTDEQIQELSRYALDIEKHYGTYMDMEWAMDERNNRLWIVQARPETVWSNKNKPVTTEQKEVVSVKKETEAAPIAERNILVKGLPASPGRVSGIAHVILSPNLIDNFKEGEILITEMTAPDWVPAMKKAKAIVTDSGGMTCHASIVSRELGIPCVVGTKSRGKSATTAIQTGMQITVDATNGVIYEGVISDLVAAPRPAEAGPGFAVETFPVTGTKIYMNLGDPDLAARYAPLPADGIGLMREEFIWTTFIHEHPLYLIEMNQPDRVVNVLADAFRKVAQAMAPRPVTLRFSDFKTSEYRDLKGGEKYEPVEPSSLLGWRGASRYYDPAYIEAFRLELRAVRKVREEFGFKNLHVMIPFCRTVEEAAKVTALMAQEGLRRGPDFKVWLMAEIPSNIILADQFNQYVDGYSIGSNDLTMLVLGCDRDNDSVAGIFDERNLAVKRAIRHLIEVAHRDGKTVSICGQAPSVYPDFTEFLVRSGIDSISVNPDAVKASKHWVAQIEQRIILEKLTGRGLAENSEYTW
ncbi:MAG: phosphoenolpyruvate synthase [Veillonellaceae bacterium]|nr:phosphoenolpyruvate synthase [Veillonellaceae bacterium]